MMSIIRNQKMRDERRLGLERAQDVKPVIWGAISRSLQSKSKTQFQLESFTNRKFSGLFLSYNATNSLCGEDVRLSDRPSMLPSLCPTMDSYQRLIHQAYFHEIRYRSSLQNLSSDNEFRKNRLCPWHLT